MWLGKALFGCVTLLCVSAPALKFSRGICVRVHGCQCVCRACGSGVSVCAVVQLESMCVCDECVWLLYTVVKVHKARTLSKGVHVRVCYDKGRAESVWLCCRHRALWICVCTVGVSFDACHVVVSKSLLACAQRYCCGWRPAPITLCVPAQRFFYSCALCAV